MIEPQPSHGQRSFPLEPSDLEREDFLAFVSHELRSPLNAIKGWAHLLRKAGPLAPAQAHALDAIERSVATQARLIESLLDGGLRDPDTAAQLQHRDERADVLVVEDDDDTRHMIEHLLREQGFEPAAFSRTADAYAYLERMPAQAQPRLIVSDIGMPEEDGYSFIRRVHALHARTPRAAAARCRRDRLHERYCAPEGARRRFRGSSRQAGRPGRAADHRRTTVAARTRPTGPIISSHRALARHLPPHGTRTDRRRRHRCCRNDGRADCQRGLHGRHGTYAAGCAPAARDARAGSRPAGPDASRRKRHGSVQGARRPGQHGGRPDHGPRQPRDVDPGAAHGRGRLPDQAVQHQATAGHPVPGDAPLRAEGGDCRLAGRTRKTRPLRPHVRPLRADAARLRADRARGRDRRHGADHRRERHGQGGRGPHHP